MIDSRRTIVVNTLYAPGSMPGLTRLAFSIRVLLENLLRHVDGWSVSEEDVEVLALRDPFPPSPREIAFRPARVLMQDFTGVPAVVDLAAMRDAMRAMGGDPARINPLVPVDLVIDHSVMVDAFGNGMAFKTNVEMEYERNKERYEFLRWGGGAFDNFRVVPPGTGICHQVNLEYLAQTVWTKTVDGVIDEGIARPVMVDCSHGNSRKDPKNQLAAGREVLAHLRKAGAGPLMGLLLESHLVEGRQDWAPGKALTYGQSITDACLGWDDTELLLREAAEAVRSARG